MKFEYNLTDVGCASGKIVINRQKLDFDVSYVCDPLSDLLKALTNLTPGYTSSDFEGDTAEFDWKGEEASYEWRLRFISFEKLEIEIKAVDDWLATSKKAKVAIKARVNYFDFIQVVTDELGKLLKKHGLIGYYASWAYHKEFPLTNYLKLKYFLEMRRPVAYIDNGNDTFSSVFEKELMLMRK